MIKILVVDDEEGICDNIKQIFTYIGFTVFTATTAQKALSIFEKEKPKIIFLDIIMPDVDGLDLLRKFKEIDPACIVLMVTASQDEAVRERALQLKADEFIQKPFSRNYLRDTVMYKIKEMLDKGGRENTLRPIQNILAANSGQVSAEDLKKILAIIEPVRSQIVKKCN